MSSSRLPGKVLLDLAGKPMLEHVVRRVRRARMINEVLVATTTDPTDDPVADFCRRNEIGLFRGSQFDVLDRYYQSAKASRADVVVRITADCPLIDPQLVDVTIAHFLGANDSPPFLHDFAFPWHFAANRLPPPWGRTYPIGLDTEVCSFATLEYAWQHARQPYQREHVMPYLYENSPVADSRRLVDYQPPQMGINDLPVNPEKAQFRVLLVNHTQDYGHLRWTVDTRADLLAVRQILQAFQSNEAFTWMDVLAYTEAHPEIYALNAMVQHKNYSDIDERGINQ
jgi:spore coat polysaccharide biosynthesis protein SpsF